MINLLKSNCEMYGEEILEIQAASDKWLIKYFEDQLYSMLDFWAILGTKYSKFNINGYGSAEPRSNYERFNLNLKQCKEIHSFIEKRYCLKNGKP